MLRTLTGLSPTEALARLANAGAPLRPSAPGEAFVLSPDATETLKEAAQKVKLGARKITAIVAGQYDQLSDAEAQSILALLTKNMAEIGLTGVDQRAALERVRLRAPSAFEVPKEAILSTRPRPRIGLIQLAVTTVMLASLAGLAAGSVHQQNLIKKLKATITENERTLKSMASEKDSFTKQIEYLTSQNAELRAKVDELQSKLQGIKPSVISELDCSGVRVSLDRTGNLHWTVPPIPEGQTVSIAVVGNSRMGRIETRRFESAANSGKFGKQEGSETTDLISISSLSVFGHECKSDGIKKH